MKGSSLLLSPAERRAAQATHERRREPNASRAPSGALYHGREREAPRTCDDGLDKVRAEAALVQGARHEVAERLWLDGALLLHAVQVDALPQLVAHRDRVGREARQAKVGAVGRGEHLRIKRRGGGGGGQREGTRAHWQEERGRAFSKLQATVRAWLPSRKSQAIATQPLPTMAMQEPWMGWERGEGSARAAGIRRQEGTHAVELHDALWRCMATRGDARVSSGDGDGAAEGGSSAPCWAGGKREGILSSQGERDMREGSNARGERVDGAE